MAAYCRVSTDQEEQLLSYENQVNYYTKFIKDNPLYTFAGSMQMKEFLQLIPKREKNSTA